MSESQAVVLVIDEPIPRSESIKGSFVVCGLHRRAPLLAVQPYSGSSATGP